MDSLKLLKTTFESLDVGFLLMRREAPDDDESYRCLYANDAGAALLGMKSVDFVGKRMVDAFPNLKEAGLIDIYEQVLQTGKTIDSGELSYGDDRVETAVFRCKFISLSEDLVAVIYTNITAEKHAQALLQEKNEAILAMSTPVIELWKGILLLPLIGELDATRAMQMIDHLLHAIVEYQARVAIFDITGVPTVDTRVAQYLMQSVQAARMLGAEVILTGISPDTAITLVNLGVDISGLQTHRSLHRGIVDAYRLLGLKLVGAA